MVFFVGLSGYKRRVTTKSSSPMRTAAAWAVALVLPAAVGAALLPVRSTMQASNVSLVLVVVIVLAAMTGGRSGGVVAALSAFTVFDVLFTRPYGSFVINQRGDVETAVLLVVVGLIAGELVVRVRTSESRAAASRADTERVRRLSAIAAGSGSRGALIRHVERELIELLGVEDCRFESAPFAQEFPALQYSSVRIPSSESSTPEVSWVAIPVVGQGHTLGRFLVDLPGYGMRTDPSSRGLAVALADQLGAALARSEGSSMQGGPYG